MNSSLGLVVNAGARAVKRRYLRHPFWRGYLPDDWVRVTANLAELRDAISGFRQQGVHVLAALGGDGTLHYLVDALIREYAAERLPHVLALAGGTMNGIPRALGSGGAPDAVFRDVLRGGRSTLRPTRLLRVVDARDKQERHGFSFATGLVYRALEHYYRGRNPGWIAAVRASLVPLTASLDTIRLQATVNGAPWLREPPHTLAASVFANPLLWFRPFGAPLENETSFHLGATSMRRSEIAPRLLSIFRGSCRHERLRVGTARDVAVQGDGGIGYVMDGEMYPVDAGFDMRLTLGPELCFVMPGR